MPVYTESQPQQFNPAWPAPFARPVSRDFPNQHIEQETHNWQDVPYSPMQRSLSARPPSQAPYFAPGLSTSYTPSPRLLPPPPTHVSYASHIPPGFPIETIDGYTSPDHIQGHIASATSQNIHSATQYYAVSPNISSQSHTQDEPLTPGRARPPPILIPSLPNPHDSQGVLHSPRPVPSPKPSFAGSVPKSGNVTKLERMADEVGKQTDNLSLDLPKGDAGVDLQRPQGLKLDRQTNLYVDKTLPTPPVPSSKDRHLFAQRPRVNTLFRTEGTMADHSDFSSSTNHVPPAPPTPLIAAITSVKFPKAPTELSGLGANLGKDVPPESGLDALERRLLAEVGTRKFDAEQRPHVRSVVQPITIPPSGPPPDTVNDSAISSLTLADREGILKASPEREQEQDRDSDERTQHMGGGRHSHSEDDRDARTQKGKSSRKLGKSKHSEEDLERANRRRERKKAKDDEGRKLRQEAKGRVAAWLGEIDASASPVMDDPTSFISPTASRFVPITESESFSPALAETATDETRERHRGDIAGDKDVSASPNPRSSGFVTISSLNGVAATSDSGGEASPFKPSPRRSSVNDFRQAPTPSPNRPSTTHRPPMSRSPSAEVKPSQPSDAPPRTHPSHPPQPSSSQPGRLPSGRIPRLPPKPADPEVQYDVRSARGGRGGKVAQVASLWAAKASANAKAGDMPPAPLAVPKKPKVPMMSTTGPPAVRKPVGNVLKRSPILTRSPPGSVGAGAGAGSGSVAPVGINRMGVGGGAEMRIGAGPGLGLGLGTREVPRATKATTVPAVVSSSHAVPMLSSTASLARVKAPYGPGQQGVQPEGLRTLPPMISETISDLRCASKSGGAVKTGVGAAAAVGPGRPLGELAFGQARLRDLIKKYQG